MPFDHYVRKFDPATSTTLSFVGIDTGSTPLQVVSVRAHPDRSLTVVVKQDGHKYWSGLGMPWSYAPTRYTVYTLFPAGHPKLGGYYRDLKEGEWVADEVAQFPVKWDGDVKRYGLHHLQAPEPEQQ